MINVTDKNKRIDRTAFAPPLKAYHFRQSGLRIGPSHYLIGDHLVEIVLEKGIPRKDVRIAVHDYKIRKYVPDSPPVQPDYFCVKHVIEREEDDNWIHYSSHELVGLTEEERETHYYSQDEGLREAMEFLYGIERVNE